MTTVSNSPEIEEINRNPLNLNTRSSSKASDRIINKRGRPKAKNAITFGPQPKSIVAQMLFNLKKEKPKEGEIIVIDDNESSDSQDEDSNQVSEVMCEICCHRSSSEQEHYKHLNSHKQFTCDYPGCTYTCKLSCNLVKHKRIHSDEKPYFCELCAFRSNFVNSLKAHKRIHTSEKPYECSNCDYKCNSSSNLKKHYQHRHPGCL